MKKLISTLIFIFIASFSYAQDIINTPPDYKTIEQVIKNPDSPYFYPKLFARFKDFDDQFTLEEFRYLYYGYTFQKEYQPYKRPTASSNATEYLRKALEPKDVPDAEKIANNILLEDPFNVDAIRLLIRTNTVKGNDEASKKVAKIYQDIMVTIISTGDGSTCDTAFHVQSINHEYLIMSLLKLRMQKQLLKGRCDYLEFDKNLPKPTINGKQLDGFYFNISRLQDTFSIEQIQDILDKK